MFIYPDNLKAKPMLWLWLLRDIAVIGVAALLSVLALSQGLGMGLLVVTVLYSTGFDEPIRAERGAPKPLSPILYLRRPSDPLCRLCFAMLFFCR